MSKVNIQFNKQQLNRLLQDYKDAKDENGRSIYLSVSNAINLLKTQKHWTDEELKEGYNTFRVGG